MTLSTMLQTMSSGMLRTCGIFLLTLIGSLPLGMVVALLRKSRFAPVRGIIRIYISIIRGIRRGLKKAFPYCRTRRATWA